MTSTTGDDLATVTHAGHVGNDGGDVRRHALPAPSRCGECGGLDHPAWSCEQYAADLAEGRRLLESM